VAEQTDIGGPDALALARALIAGLDEIRNALPPPPGGVGQRLREHLREDPRGLPGVVERFPVNERVNLQLALDEVEAGAGRWDLIGLQADVGNFGGFSITGLAGGRFGMHIDEQPVEYAPLPVDVDQTLDCFRAGLILAEHDGVPVGILVFTQQHGPQPELVVEVVGAADGAASDLLGRIKTLMRERNVYRGKVISFSFGHHGEFGLRFAHVPTLVRSDVIMPDADLEAIEDHTMVMSSHADALRAAGQHLRRGLLLYGPPGTGKTHTVMYLCNELEGRTVILLAGPALHAIGQAGSLARELAPAMIVIEDVDLIGMDRGLPGGEHNPLLFQLLNEMDGIGDDADVIFLLTTNRIDLLEPALAARPGRVDRAVEIGLPDGPARRRLLQLYLPDDARPSEDAVDRVLERTEGAAAAFVKELARRTVLARITHDIGIDDALERALDEMLEHAPPILRRSLGIAVDDD
jgi:cell division protease FtsH